MTPHGEVYAAVKPILYPRGLPDRGIQSRDISIIKRLLRGYTHDEIVAMCRRMRQKVDAGELIEWASPGGNFRLALVFASNPALLVAEAMKEKPKQDMDRKQPVSLASLLGEYGV